MPELWASVPQWWGAWGYLCMKVTGEVLIIGDLHFSDVFTGKHKDYLTECCGVLRRLTDEIQSRQPGAVVLLGDLVGWNETNIRHREVLSVVMKALRDWNRVCPVYAVQGNHDMKGYPDFLLFADMGLIRTSSACMGHFDFYGSESQELPEVRFHLVDYKAEDKALDLLGGTSNIVLGHNNYTINGVTTWYSARDGLELGMMRNFVGVDMVVSGHIHVPSPEVYATQMPDGGQCMLFYPGCPTRPIKDRYKYDTCWLLSVKYNGHDTDINPVEFELEPWDTVFYPEDEFVEEAGVSSEETLRREKLQDILQDLLKYRMGQGDPFEQIDRIPNASDAAKEVAKKYLQAAFNS